MTSPLPIDRVLQDTRLLGAELGDISTWSTWLIVLRAAFGHQLDDDELQTFKAVAGGRVLPLKRVRELWCVIGRRGGKSRMAAALACYFALFVKHKLSAGEKGMVLVLAATVEQAQVVFGYTLAFLNNSPALTEGDCLNDAKRNPAQERHCDCHSRQLIPQCAWQNAVRLHLRRGRVLAR
jgi:hypothetical protein